MQVNRMMFSRRFAAASKILHDSLTSRQPTPYIPSKGISGRCLLLTCRDTKCAIHFRHVESKDSQQRGGTNPILSTC